MKDLYRKLKMRKPSIAPTTGLAPSFQMSQQLPPRAISQYPPPPRRYYQACTTQSSPPPPPSPPAANESYAMFGRIYTTDDTLPSLEEAGRKRLYDPSAPPCQELRRMNKSLLQLFVKLVKALCEPLPPDANAQPHQQIVQDIEDTFINMQYLINVMRPAQAAMDLKTILDRQTTARKDMTEKLKDSVRKAWDLVGDAAEKLSEPSLQLSEQAGVPVSVHSSTDNTKDTNMHEASTKLFEEEDDDDDEEEPSQAELLAQIAQITQDPAL